MPTKRESQPHEGSIKKTPMALHIAMICAMLGTFMQVLDSTIANVALPFMQGGLQASRDQITWVLTSYIVAAAIMTAPVGWISSRLGRKTFLLVSIAGFTVVSMMCGAAQSLEQMIFFRVLQGMFGAALSPLSQALVLDLYPIEKRGVVMSIWGIVVMLGPILGPTLGGYLTDTYSWRWVFYINVPVGILAATGIFFFLKEEERIAPQRFDWTGFAFFAVAIGALQFMLDRGTTKDWFSSDEIVVEAVLAGLGAYLFGVHFWTSERTFIPHGLFKDRNFVSGTGLTFLVGMYLMGTTALLPPYLQTLGGYTVFDTGLMLAPRGLGTMIAMLLIGRIVMRSDVRIPIWVGSIILTWSMWVMSGWTPDIAPFSLGGTLFVQGIGMGLVFFPVNVLAYTTLPDGLRTDGTAMINLVRNIGFAVGVSITTTALTDSAQTAHANLAAHISPFNRALGVNGPGVMWNPHLPFGLAQVAGLVGRNALVIAYSDVFYLMLFFSLPAFVLLMLIPKPDATLPVEKPEMEFVE